ncbi:NirD/YgiW/YdeI family stress tolerance protein [Uruburuella testudinis]|uniref:NirD/YgiW/YdeI family stress tolerance protein n=1 Tax=Uruburuella testudinis TaxID=1282863 RepID=A0ABY4DSY5_9NEIS|nr:NirD/YgiW/YdeI family stress tolerance protein [Uruburuella testudinis]UOO82156.1 NirD/YgiW/YdeI family stress tolerance protein [Uruburuella testudinis]
MNKTKLTAFLLAAGLSVSGVAAAETFGAAAQNQQGAAQTVAAAKKLADDHKVVLEGSIVKKTGHEHYEFRDASGSVTVEIDDDDWRGLSVTAADKVRIEGEVEHKRGGQVEIEVDRIVKL